MYKIPEELDLSPIIGEYTTQIRIGPSDIQFTYGKINFYIQSSVILMRNNKEIGKWECGQWPDSIFSEIFNIEVKSYEIIENSIIIIKLQNDIEIKIEDDSEQYESFQITIDGDPKQYII